MGNGLSAAEHALLCTVVPECALLPDIAAMHDFYHPNVALYSTEQDRDWKCRDGVHLGFYVTTMLHEFAVHRGCMQRFTFVHLMYRMGFAVADINFYVTFVEDTFYRRILCDSKTGRMVPMPSAVDPVFWRRVSVPACACIVVSNGRICGIASMPIKTARTACPGTG